ncbi:hypothetical protein P6O00_003557 [Klebsiella michiganensis]|uniref:hypothetical protein n=1 Tax=Klebsiella TaxID=570 RepID=UPI000A3FB3C1|nr:hypothetical protein [Klebsiella pneumoniae]EKQ6538370.1 hypothetical protein [Klebsiella michiganensis]ELQ7989140.1 hypothetical protein [Klebsiella michiganensis]SWK44079.1 Uncharacterised protein [Klebsiella pneumoniae]VGB90271.1 Uncharacterised protein [Klebsiella pneumoniae]HBY2235282.1 hypothetical protein [Klebsiella pneumoniae]
MTNNQLNRERLEKIKSWRETYGAGSNIMLPAEEAEELARIALAAMDSKPVILYRQVNPVNGMKTYWAELDPEEFRHLKQHTDENAEFMTLYRHTQPVPVVSADLLHTAASAIEDLLEHTDPNTSYYSGMWADVPGKLRAAMFQAKSLTGNSPVIGIDLASGPDRTVEVHYVAPPGYVMVPKEPTEAMMLHNSGCQHHAWDDPDCAMRQTRRLIWSHMLAAAPQEVK